MLKNHYISKDKNIKIYNGDCEEVLDKLIELGVKVQGGFTSPPYNLNVKRKGGDEYNKKYTTHEDHMNNEDYIKWQISILNKVEKILEKDGCFLYNINYGGEKNETMWLLISEIIKNTNFTIADQLIWKKSTAIPNNRSKNKVTRICENIFVLCRKDEYKTFNTNKKVVSVIESTGQNNYENIYNFIEAKNNDGSEYTKTHKATFSTDL